MGHTLPPLSYQFKIERQLFSEMRRALLLRNDKALFDDLWNKAEFHMPAADKAKHPLPIFSIALCMNLEQEKSIFNLEQKNLQQDRFTHQLQEQCERHAEEITRLKGQLEALLSEMEELRLGLRAELIEILYPNDVS
jgi:hypothetical protein